MGLLTVRHVTTYRYAEPVRFGEHRMMFRPRESHDLRLISAQLNILPHPSDLRWLHDVFDNSVAIATFDDASSELRFDSTVTLEHIETALPDYTLDSEAQLYPFCYSDDDRPDLVNALARQYPWDDLGPWTARFLDGVWIDDHDDPAALDDARHQGRVPVRAPSREGCPESRRDASAPQRQLS